MAFTVVLGLAATLSVANYGGNAFEFSGLDPSAKIKTPQLKPTATNQAHRDQIVPAAAFDYKSAAAAKSFAAPPFDPFKSSYQPAASPFRTANYYQPFGGPYPGYHPGHPVFYSGGGHGGHGGFSGYPAANAFPSPYRFDGAKPFGFQQPYPAAQPLKFGPSKKFNKNFPGPVEFDQPGRYFQEHQFGAYHGPEFTSAVVPAEHHVKYVKPKDAALLGKPVVPSFSGFGASAKQGAYGFAAGPAIVPQTLGYHQVPNFPQIPTFFGTEDKQSVKIASSTVAAPPAAEQKAVEDAVTNNDAAVPSSSPADEPATPQRVPSAEEQVTGEPSAAAEPAGDSQPESAPQEEVTAADAEVATNNEVPAAAAVDDDKQQSGGGGAESTEVGEPGEASVDATKEPAAVEPQEPSDGPAQEPVAADSDGGTAGESAAAVDNGSDDGSKSERVQPENKPAAESAVPANSQAPGVPNVAPGAVNEAALALSDPSSSVGLFPGAPSYFGQSAVFQQPLLPSYVPSFYNNEPKFTEEELRAALAGSSFGAGFPLQQSTVFLGGGSGGTVKIPNDGDKVITSKISVPVNVDTVGGTAEKKETAEGTAEKKETAEGVAEKKETVETAARSDFASSAETPKKIGSNTVQILPQDPFNGQLPVLYDPSNTGSPLDAYRFYSHPSVSALSNHASLASYSPEDAFSNFGLQFQRGYLVEGSPSLTPASKTVVLTDNQTPISISSKDHPLHSQVFKYSQSFVPYPQVVSSAGSARSFEAPSAPATATVTAPSSAPEAEADAAVSSTTGPSTEDAAVDSSSSSTETAAA